MVVTGFQLFALFPDFLNPLLTTAVMKCARKAQHKLRLRATLTKRGINNINVGVGEYKGV
jgi:hypothetical protein